MSPKVQPWSSSIAHSFLRSSPHWVAMRLGWLWGKAVVAAPSEDLSSPMLTMGGFSLGLETSGLLAFSAAVSLQLFGDPFTSNGTALKLVDATAMVGHRLSLSSWWHPCSDHRNPQGGLQSFPASIGHEVQCSCSCAWSQHLQLRD